MDRYSDPIATENAGDSQWSIENLAKFIKVDATV
jgi:hypothetical protein